MNASRCHRTHQSTLITHLLVCVCAALRVGAMLAYANARTLSPTAAVALAGAPYALLAPLHSFLIFGFAGIYHFAMGVNGVNPFDRVKRKFLFLPSSLYWDLKHFFRSLMSSILHRCQCAGDRGDDRTVQRVCSALAFSGRQRVDRVCRLNCDCRRYNHRVRRFYYIRLFAVSLAQLELRRQTRAPHLSCGSNRFGVSGRAGCERAVCRALSAEQVIHSALCSEHQFVLRLRGDCAVSRTLSVRALCGRCRGGRRQVPCHAPEFSQFGATQTFARPTSIKSL
jgi:hypothetical protein